MPPKKIVSRETDLSMPSIQQTNIKIKQKTIPKQKTINDNIPADDIIDKEDFESQSEEDKEEGIVEDEEQKEDDEDELKNVDYGDEENKEVDEVEEYDQDEDAGTCMYKFNKKQTSDSEEEGVEEIIFDDEDTKITNMIVKDEDRIAKQVLTKYERVRILGDRAKQLSLGAKPMLLNVDNMNPKEIAKLELERKVIPLKIEKVFPDGRCERWKISELNIIN